MFNSGKKFAVCATKKKYIHDDRHFILEERLQKFLPNCQICSSFVCVCLCYRVNVRENRRKKYSDFGGAKKNNLIQSFCHIT
jgi:hypothetical protein